MAKRKIPMPSFKVLHMEKEIEFRDVVSYLVGRCESKFKSEKNLQIMQYWENFVKFILNESMYIWWARCEYECLIRDAEQTRQTKIDWHGQIEANLDLLCYEIYKYLRDNKHILFPFALRSNETIGYKNVFSVMHINPETRQPEYINIMPYLLEYFLQRYNNEHYNFKDFAELKGLVSNALEEKYAEGNENKILVTDWPNETKVLETNSFEVALQNIDVISRVFYANYEHYFKKFPIKEL